MKKNIPFSVLKFILWLGLASLSGNSAFAQSSTLTADGVYVPRLTTTQRNAITSPTIGQIIYNTDDECFNVYQKLDWQKLCGFDIKMTETWTRKADFGGVQRRFAVGFSIGSKGYIGAGYSGGTLKDFWEYDISTDSWTQKADVGGMGRMYAVGFSIGSKGYIGTGNTGSGAQKDFWEYDAFTDKWTQKADFGGVVRSNAVGFSIGSKGYIGTGEGISDYQKDFWEYDAFTDKWTQKADFGGVARSFATGFSMNNKGYIGSGQNGNSAYNDFWEYNPVADTWIQKANIGDIQRFGAVGFSIGNKGYIGTGYDLGLYQKHNDFWEYDPTSTINGVGIDNKPKGSWIQKKEMQIYGVAYSVGFSIGNKGYVGTGFGGIGNSFWEYNANDSNLTKQGNNFNGNNQLVKTDATGKILTAVLPDNITTQGNTFNQADQLLKLNTSGFLGIGVISPKAYIHVPSSVTNRKIILWQQNDNENEFFGFGINSAELRYQVDATHSSHLFYRGNGENASTELFRIKGTGGACLNGNMVTTGASCSSDIRYKRNLTSIENPLDKVLQMNGFHYYWKTEQFKEKNFPESRQIGFIAQEVEQLFPELVNTDEKGYKSVDYARLTPVLVEAIKELKKENNTNKEQSDALIKEIRKDMEALKNLILQSQNGK